MGKEDRTNAFLRWTSRHRKGSSAECSPRQGWPPLWLGVRRESPPNQTHSPRAGGHGGFQVKRRESTWEAIGEVRNAADRTCPTFSRVGRERKEKIEAQPRGSPAFSLQHRYEGLSRTPTGVGGGDGGSQDVPSGAGCPRSLCRTERVNPTTVDSGGEVPTQKTS